LKQLWCRCVQMKTNLSTEDGSQMGKNLTCGIQTKRKQLKLSCSSRTFVYDLSSSSFNDHTKKDRCGQKYWRSCIICLSSKLASILSHTTVNGAPQSFFSLSVYKQYFNLTLASLAFQPPTTPTGVVIIQCRSYNST